MLFGLMATAAALFPPVFSLPCHLYIHFQPANDTGCCAPPSSLLSGLNGAGPAVAVAMEGKESNK